MKMIKTFSLKLCFITFALSFAALQAWAGEAGKVTFATGDASIVRADKSVLKAAKNTVLHEGDTVETKSGRLQLSLIDGGKVSLQPNTIYKINKYAFSGKEDGSEYALTELIKGGLRTITGLIGHKNRERYQLKTAVATIGIRGTEFTVNYNENYLLMTTNHGSVDVCNASGCLNAITAQSIVVDGINSAPKPSEKAAIAAAAPVTDTKVAFAEPDTVTDTGVPNVIEQAAEDTINTALQNYKGPGYASVVMKTTAGNGVDAVLDATIETNQNSQPIDIYTSGNTIDIHPTTFSESNSDGIVAWGRASNGTVDINYGSFPTNDVLQWMDYAVGTRPDPLQIATLVGTYHVFGSTSPILVDANGGSTSFGMANKVAGHFDYNFGPNSANGLAPGSFAYGLSVYTNVDTFVIAGGGNLSANNPSFYSTTASSTIISQGSTCISGCTIAALPGGRQIQGAFFGTNGERIGLQYGFGISSGNVYGTAVLK